MIDNTPKTLASFDNWQINRMTPQQKSDFSRQLLDTGFSADQVEKFFGPPNLTPTEAERERTERVAYLRANWTGDKSALEAALKKAGF